jgi:hypothetical protein
LLTTVPRTPLYCERRTVNRERLPHGDDNDNDNEDDWGAGGEEMEEVPSSVTSVRESSKRDLARILQA